MGRTLGSAFSNVDSFNEMILVIGDVKIERRADAAGAAWRTNCSVSCRRADVQHHGGKEAAADHRGGPFRNCESEFFTVPTAEFSGRAVYIIG
jgi:hypothetical protein